MSHYAVFVAIDKYSAGSLHEAESRIDGILAPYCECTEDPEFLEFDDRTDELLEDFAKQGEESNNTLDDLARDYGYEKDGDRYGYMLNPNAKWDWYQIGGRWSGPFLTACGPVNTAKVGDILWDEMRRQSIEEGRKSYDELKQAFDTKVAPKHSLCAIAEDGVTGWGGDALYIAGESLEEYLTRRGYDVQRPVNAFAFINKDGKWNEKGEMGWFGLSSNNKEEETWSRMVQDFLLSLDPEDYLVVVDCHI